MVLLVALLGCETEPAHPPSPAPADPHAGHTMPAGQGGQTDHADHGAMDHSAQGHGAQGHGAHGAGSAHMADMIAHRDALRSELGEAYDAPVPGLDQADAERGRAVYAQQCATCHGPEGKGDGPMGKMLKPPAADFTDAFHARFYSDAARVHIIRNGIPKTGMTGFQSVLTPEQVLDVYAYVRTLREKK